MRLRATFLKICAGAMLLAGVLVGLRALIGAAPANPVRIISYGGARCASDALLVKFKPGVGEGEVRRALSAARTQEIGAIRRINVRRVGLPAGSSLADKLAELRLDPRVAYAEPDYCLSLASTTPSDPYFHYQWGLRNTGQPIAPASFDLMIGTPGADIKTSAAWDVFQGTAATLVGVVDTGVDLTHPDLVNRIYSSGKDFVNNDDEAQDDHGHGTEMAGIIAAEGNNGRGVSGINWNARLLPAKVFDSNAIGLTSWVASGIIWAAENGARVINMSLGGPDVQVTETLKEALEFAAKRDVVPPVFVPHRHPAPVARPGGVARVALTSVEAGTMVRRRRLAELVDARDSKSRAREGFRVRFPGRRPPPHVRSAPLDDARRSACLMPAAVQAMRGRAAGRLCRRRPPRHVLPANSPDDL